VALNQGELKRVQAKIVAEDGTECYYQIFIMRAYPSSSAKLMTSFSIGMNMGTIDETNHKIAVTVPYGTNVTDLSPAIVASDQATVSPTSGTAQDFTSPVTYTVTAEDGTKQDYVVTVTVEADTKSTAKAITAFSIGTSKGTIDETNHKIAVTLPYGTSVTALGPTIANSNKSSVSPTSGTSQDFTSPVTYTVTAEDGTKQDYVVTVTVADKIATSYTVTFVSSGSTYDKINAVSGSTISLPTNPTRSGYTFGGWYDADGKAFTSRTTVSANMTVTAKWTSNSGGSIGGGGGGGGGSSSSSPSSNTTTTTTTTTTTATTTPTPTPDTTQTNPTTGTGATFTDVQNHWAKDSISYVTKNGYFSGTSATAFDPDSSMTRGMLVSVLYRVEGKPAESATSTFADVDSSAYYAAAVAWSNAAGIVSGVSNTSFSPNSSITREQLAMIIYQYAKSKKLDVSKTCDLSKFSDASSVSDWANVAMEYAVAAGIISGRDNGTLDPTGTATRAEVAHILQVFIEQVEK